MALSLGQVAQYAYNAGFRGNDLVTAVAITVPESGDNPNALNAPERGIGLWQITPGTSADYDPQTNANDAYKKYVAAGYSFSPWTTYTGGEYRQYLGAAANAIASLGSAISSGVSSAGQAVASPSSWFSSLMDSLGIPQLSDLFTRGGLIILGLLIVLVGLWIAFHNSISSSSHEST